MSNAQYYGMLSLPHASEDFKKKNPRLFEKGGDATCTRPSEMSSDRVTHQGKSAPTVRSARRGKMNKTESEYALILEAQKRRGEILRYEFEGITLRWADMKYTPDFVVFYQAAVLGVCLKLIEVKGGYIWSRDIVRFKGACAYWPEFQFEMWQKKRGEWTRLH